VQARPAAVAPVNSAGEVPGGGAGGGAAAEPNGGLQTGGGAVPTGGDQAILPGEQHAPPKAQHPQYATKHLVPEVWSVAKGEVALTIDDGPSPYTHRILDVLERYDVPVTFFFVGNRVSQWRSAVLRAQRDGDVIGNHSESHPLLTDLSAAEQAAQIETAKGQLEAVIGRPVTLFRPPYGAYNDDTEQVMVKDHLTLVLWNRDPRDWEAKTPAQVVDAVVKGNPSGGVFDLHENALTLAALPDIIAGLKKQGLRFVVLGDGTGRGTPAGNSTGPSGGGGWPPGNRTSAPGNQAGHA
jgi:peptidoglycan/xylan/chitin deacetylase (PgdA/CDA1 family)